MLALVGLVVLVVGAPLRRARRGDGSRLGASSPSQPAAGVERSSRREHDALQAARAELEAAREAKYREIRDTELDYRTGKLSRDDYQAIDADLRAEALTILDRLERLSSTDA